MSFKQVTVLYSRAPDVPLAVKTAVRLYWTVKSTDPLSTSYFAWFGSQEDKEFQIISDYIRNNGENPDDGSVLVHYQW